MARSVPEVQVVTEVEPVDGALVALPMNIPALRAVVGPRTTITGIARSEKALDPADLRDLFAVAEYADTSRGIHRLLNLIESWDALTESSRAQLRASRAGLSVYDDTSQD
ncbi:MAG: hypothetical protein AAGH15_11025 [Myxococcota bacterium]